jgi:hypothetical protein
VTVLKSDNKQNRMPLLKINRRIISFESLRLLWLTPIHRL